MHDIRQEVQQALPSATFLGYVMDSTATNKAAMQVLQDEDPATIVIPCAAHALSLVLKHTAKHFKWVNDVYKHSCTTSEKLGNCSKLRDVYAEVLEDLEPGAAMSIAVHCPTRFGSRHIVMRDVLRSKKVLKVLSRSEEWEAGLGDRGSKLKCHAQSRCKLIRRC
jgi:hypothetical protein